MIHHEIEHVDCQMVDFWFSRTSDPNSYYLGMGTADDPFLLPLGAGGDSDRADTVVWITAVWEDAGEGTPEFGDR